MPKEVTLNQSNPAQPSQGYIYAATGEKYVTLARRAARALRLIHPDAQIDLFSDEPLTDSVFDEIHILDRATTRPKIEALSRSRFDQTLYLDADTLVIAPIDDVFELLGKYEFLAAQGRGSNMSPAYARISRGVPHSFPMVNSGVVALKKCKNNEALLADWAESWHGREAGPDQPHLRQLLFNSPVLFGTLPHEYNMMMLARLHAWSSHSRAPRILHASRLHRRSHQGRPENPLTLEDVLTKELCKHVRALLAADRSIKGNRGPHVPNFAHMRGRYSPLRLFDAAVTHAKRRKS